MLTSGTRSAPQPARSQPSWFRVLASTNRLRGEQLAAHRVTQRRRNADLPTK